MSKNPNLQTLRSSAPVAMSAGLAFAFATAAPFESFAQEPAAPSQSGSGVDLPTIEVEAGASANTLQSGTGLGRLPGTVRDVPQIVDVVSEEKMEQQGVTTLDQALRNVPGVTLAIGEGNGGMNGDQFKIRGFEAKGDIYSDGLRDFGVYTRDSFNYEEVQVLKGPSSESFGMGTTGGVINTVTKTPHLGDKFEGELTGGTGPLGRATIDLNKQINESTAIRLNAMGHLSQNPDRDHVEADRWGIAPSIAFGLGGDTTWTLSYLHQHTDRTPDYGVPMVTEPGAEFGKPVTEFGVPRSTFYGKETDRDISDVDILTSRFTAEATEWLTVHNDTRLAHYSREFATSVPSCSATCSADFFAGLDPTIAFGGGNPGYFQTSWGVQNITTLVGEFETGWLRHQMIVGIDLFFQHEEREKLAVYPAGGTAPDNSAKGPSSTLWNPVYTASGYYLARDPLNRQDGYSTNVGLFASDRIWLTEQVSVLAGIRWDDYFAHWRSTDTATGRWQKPLEESSSLVSPKASVIFEPNRDQTYYATWAVSNSPPGQFITNAVRPLVDTQPNLEPEENELLEAGAKVNLLGGRIGLSGALFQIHKSNAHYTDPVTGDLVETGEKHRVQGFEIGINGRITEAWTVSVAYAHLESEVRSGSYVGNRVANVPGNSGSVWTTYDLSEHWESLPGRLLVGGGVVFRDAVFTNSQNTYQLPATFSLDAMLSYETDRIRVAVNGYNLTDELNYDAGFNNRAVPAAGRTVTLKLGAKF
ncbi:TonB-dependent receptor [Faunimonas sp. B44]|uniref:TonB-dependent receptor n=1 Tax=Faunimonas sp. B44 TaxID=3461493 RepID=UPI00404442AC